MSIIRVKKEQKYFVAANAPFQDQNLSWEARGAMGYLLSKPDGWQCRNYDLVNQGPAGEHTIKRIMKELRVNGYVHRFKISKGRGKIEWITEVYETPALNPNFTNGDFTTVVNTTGDIIEVEKSADIVSTDSQKVLTSESTDFVPLYGNGSSNTNKQPTVSPQKTNTNQQLTDQQSNELLIFGKHPDSDNANSSFDTIQEIQSTGWQIRNHIVEQAIAYYLEAVREHHATFAVPNNETVRKDWYKAVNGHLQDHRIDELKVIYPAAIERLKDHGMTFSRPGSLTKSLPDVAMETQTGDVVAWL